MRNLSYLVYAIGMVLFLGQGAGASASVRTVEAGDSSSSWSGTGDIQELGSGEEVINGIVKGMLISRHKGEAKLVVHSSTLACPVRVNLDRKKDYRAIEGLCTVIAHDGKDVAYAHWRCVGNLKECQGEFTFTGGTGGFNGISGTTPFQTNIIFEQQEGKNVQAIGYAVWPNLTYTLP